MTETGRLSEVARLVMRPEEFLNLGINQVAYIRPLDVDSASVYAVYAANGELLHIIDSLADAQTATRQHELIPLIVH